MDDNVLCGVSGPFGKFTTVTTTEGITALCDGLKQSNVSSLRCVCQLSEYA